MKFNQNQIKLFNRNINALNNTVLKENLKQIKSSKFKLILGKDNLDINLKMLYCQVAMILKMFYKA